MATFKYDALRGVRSATINGKQVEVRSNYGYYVGNLPKPCSYEIFIDGVRVTREYLLVKAKARAVRLAEAS